MTPRATMRLQFHAGFTFADAERLVPYLVELGISHVYASPITTARTGSMHGYDVVDPTRVNPELGGEEGLRRLVAALRAASLGLIADIVPNHMAIGPQNAWWVDVLKHGRASRFALYFDIDWDADDPELRGKVLLPVLGKPLAEALAAGELTVAKEADGTPAIRYFDHRFPLAPIDTAAVERSLQQFNPADPQGRVRLRELLARQHYRLAWWRVANDEINWRRFFDINELVGLRMEHAEAFESTHALVFRLYAQGIIDGVRVDHVDGLSDPASYCRVLRQRLEALAPRRPPSAEQGRPYIVVEKILLCGEELPGAWGCDGTSGYDFMEEVSALQHDPDTAEALARAWASVSGRPPDFATEEQAARREILARSFSAQLGSCARAFHRLESLVPGADVSVAAVRRCLIELLAHFPIYRTYGTSTARPARDRPFLATAFSGAKASALRGDRSVLDRLHGWLGEIASDGETAALQSVAVTRFQQLSAPVAAKAVEDTAAYRYGRLISRNDVGFDMRRLGGDAGEFHARAQRRQARYPRAMLATATHDHKRGEDVRARLAVISEVADEWARLLPRWLARSASLRADVDGQLSPAAGDIAMLLQTIVGSWPLDLAIDDDKGRAAYAQRLAAWQQKAMREAKLATDWSVPNEAYESAARELLFGLVERREAPEVLGEIAAFADRIGPAGAVNGLAQALLKLTSPGVPDFYQGTEYWDFSLVDPDNRRPVDFAARAATLTGEHIEGLAATWRDGRIKQAIIARTLQYRREHARLFAEGRYTPITVEGRLRNHIVAFARELEGDIAITVVPRLSHRLLRGDSVLFEEAIWEDTRLVLERPPRGFLHILDARRTAAEGGTVGVGPLLSGLPVALLAPER
ncbi:MAG: malto-oligosyltrehalose synthase [Alphaproteobacteria bacterium]|nr:MAG: malto-oligosyltrehalose synthase [Alphaproteobacteria bacterium]